MRKLTVLIMLLCSICLNFDSPAMACTEDCNKECDYETSHAEGDIADSCEGWATFTNQIIQAAGGGTPHLNQEWIDQCVIDTRISYRQDCMNGCDKCKHDKPFLGGCFVDSIPIN